ncbi:hypothetical protein PG997_010984 [Apiospora hydei]|uniref:Uncharacterized protein n=1 Tax=Apiospora hydei TaxID=1337664 RepID=A0ABR1VHS0_9PEZI
MQFLTVSRALTMSILALGAAVATPIPGNSSETFLDQRGCEQAWSWFCYIYTLIPDTAAAALSCHVGQFQALHPDRELHLALLLRPVRRCVLRDPAHDGAVRRFGGCTWTDRAGYLAAHRLGHVVPLHEHDVAVVAVRVQAVPAARVLAALEEGLETVGVGAEAERRGLLEVVEQEEEVGSGGGIVREGVLPAEVLGRRGGAGAAWSLGCFVGVSETDVNALLRRDGTAE